MTQTEKIRDHYDRLAPTILHWRNRNRYYHDQLTELVRFLVPEGADVLELGSGTGDLLAGIRPRSGLGIDISGQMVELAAGRYRDHQELRFIQADAETFQVENSPDYIVASNLVGDLDDVWSVFRNVHGQSGPQTRFIITYFNAIWEPILRLGEKCGWKMPQHHQNWLSLADIHNLLDLAGFEVIRQGRELLMPKRVPIIATLMNRFLARLPGVRTLDLITYVVARPKPRMDPVDASGREPTVTVVVPCRNERGNIAAAVERIPAMGSHVEILFVDGNSNDGTVAEIERVIEANRGRRDVRLLHQVAPGDTDGEGHGRMLKLGKGDAVRKGFDAASGDILMILDADLTVRPEELTMFYDVIRSGSGVLVNGSRLVYPMERDAMRALNKLANKWFGLLFSWLLEQPVKDTLCGTKVMYRGDYADIARNRSYFGDFDPFGDFDILFGAAKNNLKIVDLPVHYVPRTYGDIKIERFKHGWLLLRMSWIALWKLKFR